MNSTLKERAEELEAARELTYLRDATPDEIAWELHRLACIIEKEAHEAYLELLKSKEAKRFVDLQTTAQELNRSARRIAGSSRGLWWMSLPLRHVIDPWW